MILLNVKRLIMDIFLFRYRQFLVYLGKLELLLGVVFLGAIVVSITLQIFFRYVLQSPLIWVIEFSTGCFIWGSFLCVSYALKKKRHITITTFTIYMSAHARAVLRAVAYLIMNILLIVIAIYALKIIELEGRTTTISLPITISKSWLFSVPILTSSILSLITCVYLMLAEVRAVISGKVSGPIIVIPND